MEKILLRVLLLYVLGVYLVQPIQHNQKLVKTYAHITHYGHKQTKHIRWHMLGKVWSKAISSYFPSYSPVRHSQATIRSPSRGWVSEPMLSLYDPSTPGCCPHPHIYNVAPV